MDPVTLGVIGGSALAGGLMSNSANKKAAAAAAAQQRLAQENIEKAVRELERLGIPSVEAQKIVLESPELVGLMQAENLQNSAMEGIQIDPSAMNAQKAALESLRQQSAVGLNPEDMARFEEIRSGLKAQQTSQDAGILASMAERGAGGSGQELAVRLNAAQRGNQAAMTEGMNLAAEASRARREAVANMGNLGGQMRNQSFQEQENIARAKDAINQFNLTNRQNIAQTNLAARQRLNEQQVNTRNEMEKANKALLQQDYQNRLGKAQSIANARTGQANMINQQAGQTLQAGQQKAQGISDIFGGVSDAALAYAKYKEK